MVKRIAVVGMSNPVNQKWNDILIKYFEELGLEYTITDCFSQKNGRERAHELNCLFKEDLDYIFDISGGDLAIECVPHLDLDAYRQSSAIFVGYSDVSVILNVLGLVKPCIYYQIRNGLEDENLRKFLLEGDRSLFASEDFYVGGNIRCFLKLAGTSFFPNLNNRKLFLESYSGNAYRIRSYFKQLELMNAFDQIHSLTFGQFTELDAHYGRELLFSLTSNKGIRVHQIESVGHAKMSKALWISNNL